MTSHSKRIDQVHDGPRTAADNDSRGNPLGEEGGEVERPEQMTASRA